MDPMTKDFVADIERFVRGQGVDLVSFEKGQRKDDIAHEYLAELRRVRRACCSSARPRRRPPTFRTEKRRNPDTGATYPWIVRATAMVNHYYFYCVDADFGPFFMKFCTYFPYNAKLCINGNEYAKRQAAKDGIAFEPLDNGFAACEDPRPPAADLRPAERRRRSTRWSASGSRACPTPSPPPTAGPATATTSRSCRPSSP